MNKFFKWLRTNYSKVVTSIAFYPAVIAIAFLIAAVLMLMLDFSEFGKQIKANLNWVSLKDAQTARTILSTIGGGLISLAVFSFSMVMLLLNQAASQMSNRILNSLIGARFQQVVLGFYIGSIVYALFLLSTIRDIHSGIYVPALSIYLLLVITVIDIFLFIYFLHYITQSVKYNTIIDRIYKETLRAVKRFCVDEQAGSFTAIANVKKVIKMPSSDYFQGFNEKDLIHFAKQHEGVIEFLQPTGTYLLKGLPILCFYGDKTLSDDEVENLGMLLDLYSGQPISKDPFYGYHQLAEVAIKALSPGINDPETAVLSLHVLTDLFAYRLHHYTPTLHRDDENRVRVVTVERSFEQMFEECFYPIWIYGNKDQYIKNAMLQMTEQLLMLDTTKMHYKILNDFNNTVRQQVAVETI